MIGDERQTDHTANGNRRADGKADQVGPREYRNPAPADQLEQLPEPREKPHDAEPAETEILEEPPEAVVEPPEAVVEPPEAVVEPPEAVVEPPEAVVEPPEAVVEPPEAVVEPPEAVGERRGAPAGQDEPEQPVQDVVHLDDPAEVLPALAKVAAELWLHAAVWGLDASLRAGARLARAATDPEVALELYQDVAGGVRAYAREFLGISDLDEQVRRLAPLAGTMLPQDGNPTEQTLREQGGQLLKQAADVRFQDGAHPAYARILTELAPDEARILRLLTAEGPQPIVDVRAANLIGLGSQLIAPGLNMVGAQAGLRRRERVPAYLNNLVRLGLISFSDQALDDTIAYQVLEAQPDVLETIRETPRGKTARRSIHLTPFGEDFCRVCLPLEPGMVPSTDPPPPPEVDTGSEGK